MLGDYLNVLTSSSGGDFLYIHPLALAQLGREGEAIELLRERLQDALPLPLIRLHGSSLLALLEGRTEDSVRTIEQYMRSSSRDPESLYYLARQLAHLGRQGRAIEMLTEVVDLGYVCFPTMACDPWLDPLRGNPEFAVLLRRAETRRHEAAQVFLEAAGDRILRVQPA
jgi:tetratricopeptide (TPR) repeat protein